MSALQTLRVCLGSHARQTVAQGAARPVATFARVPQACTATRRWYSSEKGKEKEDTPASADETTEKAATEDATAQKPGVDDLAAKLEAKQDEIIDLTGRLRYAQADFINLQRISAREKEQTRDFAISRFASDLLDTVDTLSMALRAAPRSPPPSDSSSAETPPPYFQPSSQSSDALLQGVEATHRLLLQTLAKYGVKPFDPTGDKFDPNMHEALYSVPLAGKKPGEVLDCQKLGYTIKDRVLRAAQVGVVADPPS
ncbi:GrpE-domain-containing protein [Ramaria rubella]|nr:GrpE-domain-containing protein [Ramaria rubella]